MGWKGSCRELQGGRVPLKMNVSGCTAREINNKLEPSKVSTIRRLHLAFEGVNATQLSTYTPNDSLLTSWYVMVIILSAPLRTSDLGNSGTS